MKKILFNIQNYYNNLSVTVKATLWFVICSTFQRIILILTTPLFTRLLTTEQYGQYTVYSSWLQVFTIITTLRLNLGGFNKAMSKYQNDRDGYIATTQTITTVLTFLVALIYAIFLRQINNLTELGTFVTIGMLVELIFSPAISFWTLKQRYEYRYKSVVAVTALIAIANAVIGLIFVLATPVEKGVARIFSCIVVQIIIGGYLYFGNYRRAKKFFCIEYAKYAIGFALPLLPHYLSVYVLEQSDRLMIQKICNTSYAGIYGIAYSAAMVMKIVTESITNALVPWLYDKFEKHKTQEIKKQVVPIMYFIIAVISIFIAFAPEIISILAGKEYMQAVYVIPPVAASIFFVFIYTIYANVEFYYEEKKFTMCISSIGAFLNIILNYLFVPVFGFVAAGYTTLICYIIFSFGHYVYMQYLLKKHNERSIFRMYDIFFPSVLMLIVTTFVSLLYSQLILRYVIICVISIILILNRKQIIQRIKSIRR